MTGESFDCEASELLEHLKRVRSIRNQSAWDVEYALPELTVLGPVQVVVHEVVYDLVDCQLVAHPFLRCTESIDRGRSSSTVQR